MYSVTELARVGGKDAAGEGLPEVDDNGGQHGGGKEELLSLDLLQFSDAVAVMKRIPVESSED